MGNFDLKVGQRLVIERNVRGAGGYSTVKTRCRVEGVYPTFVLLKRKNYKECFLISSFLNGDLKVVGGI